MSLPRSSRRSRAADRQDRLLAGGHRSLAVPRVPVGGRGARFVARHHALLRRIADRHGRAAGLLVGLRVGAAARRAAGAPLGAGDPVPARGQRAGEGGTRWRRARCGAAVPDARAIGPAARIHRVGADRGQPARVRRRARAAGARDPRAAARIGGSQPARDRGGRAGDLLRGQRGRRRAALHRPPPGLGRAADPARPQPPSTQRGAPGHLPERLLRERDRILSRSGRAGSARWPRRSAAGPSTT